ncbi:F-box protein SKIP27-like [Syzygium oleosum]|uniref:F-box protein SKIP27-like n=1 Tax=Syzygium oleosum TaxID=219896 RepID=UPI0024B97724|nr:F-box protein SKIP27-like [Syzygium oleosum]
MALCGNMVSDLKACVVGGQSEVRDGEEALGFGLVRCTRGLGRKRVGISEGPDAAVWRAESAEFRAPLKRQCSARPLLDGSEKSGLEALPQDILIRILGHVVHGDLKQLVRVSKTIKEATVVAKQCHFAYTMPTKIRVFRNSIDPQNSSDCKEIEAPNALLRTFRLCISWRKLVDVTTVLFASPNEGSGPGESVHGN